METRRWSQLPRFAALALACLAGCAADPRITAVSAQQVSTTAEGSELHLVVELENPNPAPVELTTWEYSVSVNDHQTYSGEWAASLTLPPRERIRAELPAFVPAGFGEIANAPWRVSGRVGYRATGKLDKLLYQLGINRLHAGFGTGATGIAPPPAPKEAPKEPAKPAAPASPAPSPAPGG